MRTTLTTSSLLLAALIAVLALLPPRPAQSQSQAWLPLIDRLAADGFDRAELNAYFKTPGVTFDGSIMAHKVDRMLRKQFEPQPPPSKRTLQQSSYAHYLKPWVLNWANDYARTHRDTLERAEAKYAVPQDIIIALMLVETKLGTFLGDDQAFPVLASMAASDNLQAIRPYLKRLGDSPERAAYANASAKEKSDWAYQELKALILYSKALGQSPLTIPGSIYGAIGICQFMPTNALKYGMSASGQPPVDLFKADDAIMSIASYLVGHGWKPGMNYDAQRTVIYAYNHSDLYSLAVMTVADSLRQARSQQSAAKPKPVAQ